MSTTRNRLKLIAILALFTLPLVAAALMFSGHLPRLSEKTSNLGTLIQPPIALDWNAASFMPGDESAAATLIGSWVVLLPLTSNCDDQCLQSVAGLRQVHKAAGRNQERIKLVLLSKNPADAEGRQKLISIYDPFMIIDDPAGNISDAIGQANEIGEISTTGMNSYLVDPLGNIMMAYDTADSENRLSKDLKRLLTWSKQDKG